MNRAGLLFSGNSLVWGRMAQNAIDHRRRRQFLLRNIFAVREGGVYRIAGMQAESLSGLKGSCLMPRILF